MSESLYPEGACILLVQKIGTRTAKHTDEKQLLVKSMIIAGSPSMVGRALTHSYSLEEDGTCVFAARFFRAIGFDPDKHSYAIHACGRAYEVDIRHTPIEGCITVANERAVTGLVGSTLPTDEQIFAAAERVCEEPVCASLSVAVTAGAPHHEPDGSFRVQVWLRLERSDIIR